MSTVDPLFHGEVQFAGWSDSHTGGPKIVLWLADSDQLEAFRAMTVRKGNTAGQRLAIAVVEIGDDEQPVEPEPDPAARRGPPKGLTRLAALWCQTPQFVDWCRQTFPESWEAAESTFEGADDGEVAAELIRRRCGISSRAELDRSKDAESVFIAEFVHPFRRVLGQ